MTNLKIIPDFKKKTAKFDGVIAAGEKIHAIIENVDGFIASTQNLRLRAVASDGGTIAVFPQENELGEIVENWFFGGNTIECDLNLNTVQMLEAVPPAARVMVLFVLDNPEDETLYFKSFHTVDHWPRRVGEEEPVDLGGYADFVQDAKLSIERAEATIEEASENAQIAAERAGRAEASAKAAQESAIGSVGSAATYASEAAKARDEANSMANSASEFADNAKASQTAAESAKSAAESAKEEAREYAEAAQNTLANAATKAELQAEVERATEAEVANARRISDVDTSLSEETTRAKKAESGLQTAVNEVNGKFDTLIGPIVGDKKLSARQIAAEEVTKVVANAPADLDTLKEIADYIESDKTGAAQMATKIDANTKAISAEVARAQGAETQLTNKVNDLDSDKADRIIYENAGEINTIVTLKNNVIRRVEITDADINLDVILPANDKSYRNYCEMLLVVAENATSVNLITPPNTNVYSATEDALVPEVGMNHIIFSQVGECEWVASRAMLSNIVGGGTVVLEKSSSTTLMNNYELGDDNTVGDLADKTGHAVEDDTAYGTYIENL